MACNTQQFVQRMQLQVPAASVGLALGQMAAQGLALALQALLCQRATQ